eukprot:scaffold967_cov173-Ochromonas_danica.AAC.24
MPGQPKLAFLWAMGYMTMSHIYRMYVSYLTGVFDFTGTQMVLTMKLTSFAYNIYDGMVDKENVFHKKHHDREQRVYNSRRHFAIQQLPNLLEFFGYIYCFTCILAGPAFEYKDYVDSIEGKAFALPDVHEKENKDDKIKGEKEKAIKKPNNILPALLSMFIGVFSMVAFLQFSARVPVANLYKPEYNAQFTFLQRLGIMWVTMFGERFKYYFVWKTAEGASILGGFGFEGYHVKDEKVVSKGWKGVENIDIISFETATNSSAASRAWNKRTQGWLERYTYLRTGKSLYMTYFISALWHGLYPGFFCVFFTIAWITEVEKLIRDKINPWIVPGYTAKPNEPTPNTIQSKIYNIVATITFSFMLNYTAQPFSMGSLERTLEALRGSSYYGHLALLTGMIVLSILPKRKQKSHEHKEKST